MTKYTYPALASLFLLTACEKEIDIKYHSIEPLYVIEGRITNETTEVFITQTRDIENKVKGNGIKNASVTITANDGPAEELHYQADGYYRSQSGLTGEVGKTYSLSVVIGDNEFTSRSGMNGEVKIDRTYFYWMEALGNDYLFFRIRFEDRKGEENYYSYRMYRNGKIYAWKAGRDKGNDGEIIEESFLCMTEKTTQGNKPEDRDKILYEGDVIELEIQTIDLRTYDYLNSLAMSEDASANPVSNFTNGGLGYFSAYSAIRERVVFSYADIE
jgi:hypothetical protein